MVLMTMHHMDRVIILMMYMDFVMMWTEPGFLDFGLGLHEFGQVDGTQLFGRVVSRER